MNTLGLGGVMGRSFDLGKPAGTVSENCDFGEQIGITYEPYFTGGGTFLNLLLFHSAKSSLLFVSNYPQFDFEFWLLFLHSCTA
jgi:hypothetical protein